MTELVKYPTETMPAPWLVMPGQSVAASYPFHGDSLAAIAGHPALDLVTGASGNWNAQGYYAFPPGNTTSVFNSGNSTTLDAVLSLATMQAGDQWIICHEMTVPNHTATGFLWAYGNDGASQSNLALAMISTEVFQFQYRGVGASAATTYQFPMSALPLTGQRCTVVLSIEAQSETTIVVRALGRTLGTDDAWLELGVSGVLDLRANGATANPGRTTVNHAGLTIGARPTTSWTPSNRLEIARYAAIFGNGSGTGRIGNFAARKFAGGYDAGRLAAVAADLWRKPREFPEAML